MKVRCTWKRYLLLTTAMTVGEVREYERLLDASWDTPVSATQLEIKESILDAIQDARGDHESEDFNWSGADSIANIPVGGTDPSEDTAGDTERSGDASGSDDEDDLTTVYLYAYHKGLDHGEAKALARQSSSSDPAVPAADDPEPVWCETDPWTLGYSAGCRLFGHIATVDEIARERARSVGNDPQQDAVGSGGERGADKSSHVQIHPRFLFQRERGFHPCGHPQHWLDCLRKTGQDWHVANDLGNKADKPDVGAKADAQDKCVWVGARGADTPGDD